VCADHELVAEGEPRIHPEKVDDTQIADDLVVDAIERARNRGLAEFDTKRAANTTYDDMVFFERQAFLNLADAGTTTATAADTRRFERALDRENTPHSDTHLETMKKIARSPEQTQLDDYADGCRPPD
jgi:trimethylamine:corrinoid methyltransferase-like protein